MVVRFPHESSFEICETSVVINNDLTLDREDFVKHGMSAG